MDKNELPKTVTTILNGHNYVLWSQDMRSFLKGHRLWRYVTGEIQVPVRSKDEEDTKFADRLEDWDCKNHQIITWFRHSTVPSIHQQFGRYENAKDVWDLLSRHYTTAGLSHEYQLWGLLVNMKQTPRQPINEFPFWSLSLLWQFAMSQLLSHETRLRTLQPHHPDAVLATATRPSSSSSSRNGQSGILPRPVNHSVAVAAEDSPSDPSLSSIPVSELGPMVFTMVKQFLSSSDKVSSAVSGNTWYFDSACCNHMSPDSQLFSSIIPTTHAPFIQTANGSHLAASHTGSVSTSTLSLSDTYLIPNLTLNLISVGQLCELGFDLWFGSSGCRVQDPRTNQVLGTGRRVGRMFELTSLHLPTTSTPPPSHVAPTASVFPLSLWHLRLGTSQQNGRAERKHRHILDSVRAFLISASCPERFWGEAALTAVYTINRLPSSALQNVTPFERLYGTPASYSSLRVIVVGIPISQRLRISRHVVFWEHTMFNSLSKFTTCSTPSFFTNPSLPLFPISPADSPTSPLAPPLAVDPVLDQTPDLPLAAPPADSPASPQESAPPVDPVTDQPPLLPLRRSDRVRAPPAHLRDYSCFSAVLSLHEPHTYREACTNPLWQQAMTEELQALEKTHTWDLVDLPHGKSAIGCKWVYKIKTKSDGSIERYKARLVAKGYAQEYGIDYEETFAPVARITSVRSLLAIAAVHQHLQAIQTVPDKVCLLRRALYGLKQAPRAWFAKFSSIVHQFGFSSSSHDTALFIRRSDKGLEVSSDSTGYYLSQAKYASDLLSRTGLTDTKVVSTPLEMNARLTPLDGTPLSDATLYRQLVGSLVYLTVTRPDIAHAVHLVSQFLSAPHSTHYAAVLHILRYIKGTMFHGLHFSAHSTLDLCAYSDADWAGDPTDRRSTTGFCFFLGDSLISWRSKKQHIVSRSSTEAEYRALADTTSELLALRWLLEDMGVTHSSPTVIHCDNRSAIQIAHNDVFHERTKHIEIDCHLVRHHLSAGILHLLPVSSSDQTADIFTKTFPPGRFRDLVSKLKMASFKPP
uniref:Reverse transcriptase Ty1/copia-type domain-containing protein n=1 Tax=Fagus sylvatica TaxID=28930 RepID=A0A2N9H992_FAGSY